MGWVVRRYVRKQQYGDTREVVRFAFFPKRFIDFDTRADVIVWWERYRVGQRWERGVDYGALSRARWMDCTFQLGADDAEETARRLIALRADREKLDAEIAKQERLLEVPVHRRSALARR